MSGEHQNFESYVKCPYCAFVQEETYPEPNGDLETKECGRCEKKFRTMAYIEYSSKRDCDANGLQCDWQDDPEMNFLSDRKYNWARCPNCLDTKLTKRVAPAQNEET